VRSTQRLRGPARTLCCTLVLAGAAAALSACGGGGSKTSSAQQTSATTARTPASGTSKCGLGNGRKASGAPIKLGALVTKQAGIDFTDITNMVKAFLDCVNDNGGINGRPVQYIVETEQSDPGQVGALAKKLVESEKVLAIVGGASLIDCTVNHAYWESKGVYVINAGVAGECYGTANSAAVNMGPRYSSDGAVQALLRQGVKKIAFDTPNVPGSGYISAGPVAVAKAANIPYETLKDTVPIQDANSVALRLAQAAGDDGGVVLNFTPPEALKILQAAQRQGLQNRAKWGCSTPCNTDFLAEALGSAWDGKLFVNAELNLVTADGPDSALYRQVREKYAPKIPLGSFSQMGFLVAKIATDRMLTIKGPITSATVNKALLETKDFRTDLLCKPWYFGKAPIHIPNNTDRTVAPQGGHMVQQEGCFDISADDPDIARVREIERSQGR
jgi:branched-chain amino acid transport system substrate-binding protein